MNITAENMRKLLDEIGEAPDTHMPLDETGCGDTCCGSEPGVCNCPKPCDCGPNCPCHKHDESIKRAQELAGITEDIPSREEWADDEDEMQPTFIRSDLDGNPRDVIEIFNSRAGSMVAEQLANILGFNFQWGQWGGTRDKGMGGDPNSVGGKEALEEQNSNALKMVMEFLYERNETEVAEEIENYLHVLQDQMSDQKRPSDRSDNFESVEEDELDENGEGVGRDGKPDSFERNYTNPWEDKSEDEDEDESVEESRGTAQDLSDLMDQVYNGGDDALDMLDSQTVANPKSLFGKFSRKYDADIDAIIANANETQLASMVAELKEIVEGMGFDLEGFDEFDEDGYDHREMGKPEPNKFDRRGSDYDAFAKKGHVKKSKKRVNNHGDNPMAEEKIKEETDDDGNWIKPWEKDKENDKEDDKDDNEVDESVFEELMAEYEEFKLDEAVNQWVVQNATEKVFGKSTVSLDEIIANEHFDSGCIMIVSLAGPNHGAGVFVYGTGQNPYGVVKEKRDWAMHTGDGAYGRRGSLEIKNFVCVNDGDITSSANAVGQDEERPLWVFK